jgi:signal transduction histidine kinase/ActR/RegA family two-component response regulator
MQDSTLLNESNSRMPRTSLTRRFALSSVKIRLRLPVLIGCLLVAAVLSCVYASYLAVKRTAVEIGNERLTHLTDQVAALLQQQASTLTNRTLTSANETAIRDYVSNQDPESASKSLAIMSQFLSPADQNGVMVELRRLDHSLLLSTSNQTEETPDLSNEFGAAAAAPFKSIGKIRIVRNLIVFPVVAAVRNGSGKPIGFMARWRKVSGTAEARKQLTDLLGSNATLYVGNAQGDVWTDMTAAVPAPLDVATITNQITPHTRDGESFISLARPVAGTPWMVVMELSREAIIAPAKRFIRPMTILGLGIVLLGVAGTLWMSQTITQPLNVLTQTAIMISRGDYSRKIDVQRGDELGHLAKAFHKMVTQLRESQERLEQTVHERTSQLEEANQQLRLLAETDRLKRSEAETERLKAIDALRSTEQQLQQAQKLEAVGRLAGGIAHDFNNLLTAIGGYAQLTLKRLPDHDPLKSNVREIEKAGERAAALTRQLLAFSRRQVLQPKVINLNAIISDLNNMLSRLIGEDIELRTALEGELNSVRADPGQMEQVIMNLAVNARDAMPDGGKLTIETANVYLDEFYARDHLSVIPGNYVMLALSDTGIGMDSETQAHIFEPFFTTKQPGKGTGLGLSMVYGIVKQSGGNIWLYSEKEHGTTFKIYLPSFSEKLQEHIEPTPTRKEEGGSETILVVEDENLVRQLLEEVLQGAGYTVLSAANGSEAINLSETYMDPIDLVLTDVVMPEISGTQVVTHLTTKYKNLKVLYMSGYTDDAIVHHGVLDAGVNFIQKPFTPDSISRKVREVLDKQT